MGRILFVALAFIVPLHFVQVSATRRARRVERPCAFGAGPNLHARGFDPYHLSHKVFLDQCVLCPLVRPFLFTTKVNPNLLGSKLKVRRYRKRFGRTRSRTAFLNNRSVLPIIFGRVGRSRRAFLATSIGTCLKGVFLSRMVQRDHYGFIHPICFFLSYFSA
jgi:hypothetical protein